MKKGFATVRSVKRTLCLLLVLSCLSACSFVTARAAQQADDSDQLTEAEQALFIKGQTLHSQGLNGEAVIVLNQFLDLYPHSLIKDLGLLWLGRSYLAQGDLTNAEKTGLRLKALPDTAMVGIYEEELRIARQNYAQWAAPARVRTDRIATIAQLPEPAKPTPVTASIEVTAPRAAVQDRKAIDPIALARSRANDVTDRSAAPISGREPATSGLFLPAALVIPADQRAVGNAKALSGSAVVPAPAKNEVAAGSPKPVLLTTSVSAGSPPRVATAAPTTQRVAETKPSLSVPSGRGLAVANTLAPASPKEPNITLKVDLPLLRVKIEETPRLATTDGTVSYRLIITNEGSGVGKDLTVRGELDAALDFVESDPLPNRQELIAQRQVLTFRLPMIQPGETKVLLISVRSSRAVPVNIAAQTKHSIFYRDSKGNFLHTP